MSNDSILYHYCPAQAFVSIVASQSIWLSSLSLANDTSEGRLVATTLLHLAERDRLTTQDRQELETSLAFTLRQFDGLAFCLSHAGDLLSQWRGYADDGRGVAIGFKKESLQRMVAASKKHPDFAMSLLKVRYDARFHESRVSATYTELRQLIDAGAFRPRGLRGLLDGRTPEVVAKDDSRMNAAHYTLLMKLLALLPALFELKTPAFREEREWRLVSMHMPNPRDRCQYRAADGRIIPYKATQLPIDSQSAIAEVVLGPRHVTPPTLVHSMLSQFGFASATIRRSAASYR